MRTLSALFLLVCLAPSAFAEAPYEGRTLPDGIKRLLWAKACDVVPKQSVDCAKDPCIFKDSKGESFSPDMQPWHNVLMFEWNAGSNALQPTVIESKLATEEEAGDPRTAMGLLSGLAVDLDTNDYMMQLNPALVRWVGRELIPPPDTAMCGATANEVYNRAFKGPIRQAMDVYAHLKGKGLVRGVKVAELSKNFDNQRGRLASACQSIAKKAPDDERWGKEMLCWWWMRRVATGGSDELAQLFGKMLADYDPEGLKLFAKAIPKVVAPKVTPKPRPQTNPF